eukprot:6403865-Amphidinium_carterae.1
MSRIVPIYFHVPSLQNACIKVSKRCNRTVSRLLPNWLVKLSSKAQCRLVLDMPTLACQSSLSIALRSSLQITSVRKPKQ